MFAAAVTLQEGLTQEEMNDSQIEDHVNRAIVDLVNDLGNVMAKTSEDKTKQMSHHSDGDADTEDLLNWIAENYGIS